MNAFQTTAMSALEKAPKVMGARGHAIADYVMLGGTLLMAAYLFKRNKTAGTAAVIAAVNEATNTMITDFPGGVCKWISFETHGQIDVANTAMVASLPKMMGFAHTPEAKLFYTKALAGAAVTALTDFKGENSRQLASSY